MIDLRISFWSQQDYIKLVTYLLCNLFYQDSIPTTIQWFSFYSLVWECGLETGFDNGIGTWSQGEDGADTLTSWYTRWLLVQFSFDTLILKVVSLWQMFSYYIWTYAYMVSHWSYMENFDIWEQISFNQRLQTYWQGPSVQIWN